MNVKHVDSGKYNLALAEALTKIPEFKSPEWIDFVKSGTHNSRPIEETDFWSKRAASVLRQIYVRGIVGVQRLRTRYGGRKERGVKPSEFRRGGGKIVRMILQQAEAAGFVEKASGQKKGRQLTAKGKEFMEKIAEEVK